MGTCQHLIVKITQIAFGRVIGTCKTCGDGVNREDKWNLPRGDY